MSTTAPQLDQEARSLGPRVVIVGAIANAFLAVIKVVAGVFGRSHALIADGIESTLDIFHSVMIWAAIKYARRPADREHPYGHGKMQSVAAAIGAIILITAGGAVGINSSIDLFNVYRRAIVPPALPARYTLVVLVAVIFIKEVLFRKMAKLAKQTDNLALRADAWHHRSDAISSLAALIGVSIAVVGGPAFVTADRWAALFSCIIIVSNGCILFRKSFGEIMDEQASEDLIQHILQKACEIPGVSSAEKCRVRKSGSDRIADLHIRVPGNLSVQEGHEISHQVSNHLCQSPDLNLTDVTIHIEPEPLGKDRVAGRRGDGEQQ